MKKSASGSGSIRQRPDGRWEARYSAGYNPSNGKQIQRSIYGATQKDVRLKLQKICLEIDEGRYLPSNKITVAAWLDTWLSQYTSGVKDSTKELYTGVVASRITPLIGCIKLSEFLTHHAQTFYNDLSKQLSPKSVKNIHGILHKSLEQAVENGLIRTNPTNACKLPRATKPVIKPLEDAQITQFLDAIKGHHFEQIFIFALFTGLRQGEVLGLTWDCINFDKCIITVSKQLQRINGTYSLSSPKSNKARTISPPPFILNLLKEVRNAQLEQRLFCGNAWENNFNLVFVDAVGKHHSRQTVYNNFKKIVADLGIPSARFHDLRHSYAVSALQAGDDIKTVQETLGHHTAAFTLDVYGHVTDSMKAKSADRMEQFYNSVKVT